MPDGIQNKGDDLLIERCLRKDMDAWADFVTAYSPLISTAITSRLKLYGFKVSLQDVNDIRQQLLAGLWQDNKLSEVKNRSSIPYWLAIVSGNAALAYMRRKKNMATRKFIPLSHNIGEDELGDLLPSSSPDPRDESSCNELTEKIDHAMEALPDRERVILQLHIFHNKKYRDIASIMSLPPGTVSSYIKRAKEKLKIKLRDFDPEKRNLQ